MIISPLGFFNLALMIVTLGLVLLGVYMKRVGKRTVLHATIMTTALVLTIVSVLLIMVPSLTVVVQNDLEAADWRYGLLLAHHLIGLLALGMAALLAGSWILRGRKPDSCLGRPKNKRLIMRITFSVWVLSLVFGIGLYLAFL
jgi:uncharacterized membrane protein YozB (DUF420 family)